MDFGGHVMAWFLDFARSEEVGPAEGQKGIALAFSLKYNRGTYKSMGTVQPQILRVNHKGRKTSINHQRYHFFESLNALWDLRRASSFSWFLYLAKPLASVLSGLFTPNFCRALSSQRIPEVHSFASRIIHRNGIRDSCDI